MSIYGPDECVSSHLFRINHVKQHVFTTFIWVSITAVVYAVETDEILLLRAVQLVRVPTLRKPSRRVLAAKTRGEKKLDKQKQKKTAAADDAFLSVYFDDLGTYIHTLGEIQNYTLFKILYIYV